MGKCYAFTAARGGTGTSTVCASLAVALAGRGKKVVVADMSAASPSLDLFFHVAEGAVYTLSDLADGTADSQTVALPVDGEANIRVIPVSLGGALSPAGACAALRSIRAEWPEAFLLLDMPFSLVSSLWEELDGIILSVRPDEVTLRATEYLTATLEIPPEKEAYFLLNHVSFVRKTAKKEPPLLDMIDLIGLSLIGVLPDRWEWHSRLPAFDKAYTKTPFARCAQNIAARLDGVQVPLLKGVRPEGFSRRFYIERG